MVSYMYVFAPDYATAQMGTSATSCRSGNRYINSLSLKGLGWSLQPTHLDPASQTSRPLPLLRQHDVSYGLDGNRIFFYAELITPADCSIWELQLRLHLLLDLGQGVRCCGAGQTFLLPRWSYFFRLLCSH